MKKSLSTVFLVSSFSLISLNSYADCSAYRVEYLKSAPATATVTIDFMEKLKDTKWVDQEDVLATKLRMQYKTLKDNYNVISGMTPEQVEKNCGAIKTFLVQSIAMGKILPQTQSTLAAIDRDKEQIKKESNCKTEEECNQVLNDRLISILMPNEKREKIDPSKLIGDPNVECSLNRTDLLGDLSTIINDKKELISKISENDWIDTKTSAMVSLYDSTAKVIGFYDRVKTANQAEYNTLCPALKIVNPTIDKTKVQLNARLRAIETVNRTKKLIMTQSNCETTNNCKEVLNKKLDELTQEIYYNRNQKKIFINK